MSLASRVVVGTAAVAFVALTAWQLLARRDDWPLAAFHMYSVLQGPTASRVVIRGVTDDGELELGAEQTAPLGGARLRSLNDKLVQQPQRHERFVQQVVRRYDAQRAARGWPGLQGVRWYSEVWRIQPGLAGIDHPESVREGSLYLPPASLLARLASERSGAAAVAELRPAPSGDGVFELSAPHCTSRCDLANDPYAAHGDALELDGSDDLASATIPLTLEPGSWALFLRLRSHAGGAMDHLSVSLDDEEVELGPGRGNYAALGGDAWVWVSGSPGEPPVRLSIGAGAHRLTLHVDGGTIDADQIWLSRSRKELPMWSEPVSAS